MNEQLHILKRYWGYSSFRPGQESIINSLSEKKDTLAILPTGGGKSICYQIPALLHTGCALIISPLIALMNDQVNDLKKRGIPAEVIHSGQNNKEIVDILEEAQSGTLKFLYCSPERLHNDIFLEYAESILWNYLIVDEAHCISEWGHDFRPQYLNISEFKDRISHITTGAFTASATLKTQEEIILNLKLKNPHKFINSIYRDNISYQVFNVEHKEISLIESISRTSNIIYCNTRKATETTSALLKEKGIPSNYFHAGLSHKERNWIQEDWLRSDDQTVCSTNAFGMGINKINVRQVFHLNAPYSLESYYQESGRAGRDEQPAEAILLSIPHDKHLLERSILDRFPSIEIIKAVYDFICQQLHIAYHEGFEEKHFIDIPVISKKSNIHILQFISSIKILESENIWIFNQDDISSNYIQILCSRNEMNFLEKQYPTLYSVIIQLLRTHGDIMNYDTPVSIELIARQLQDTYNGVAAHLEQLAQMNFIKWKKNRTGSSIYLTQSRVPVHYLHLNEKKINQRKKIFTEKIRKMIEYTFEYRGCRQKFIAEYFGEKNNKKCDICDNCLNDFFHKNYTIIRKEVIQTIKENKGISINDLILRFKHKGKKGNIYSLLNELNNDDDITIKNTIISLKY